MLLLHAATDLPRSTQAACLAIGVFDGVHLGHQQVIRQMVADARRHEGRPVVITFDRHPNTVVAPERVPPQIYALPQKMRAIAALGVDFTWLIHFDEPFSKQSGEQFVRGLVRDFGRIHSICVGSNFTFGHRRSGDVELLKRLGAELGFNVHGLAAVSLDGEPVSSTRIREAIRAGQLDLAGQMLGRPYSLAGSVVPGDQLGRQLGFPTANLDTTGLLLPPTGVYAIQAHAYGSSNGLVGAGARTAHPGEHGQQQDAGEASTIVLESAPASRLAPPLAGRYRGLLNIGYRPTLRMPTPQLRVEVHLFDFNADLYGQELEVAFVDKIREEQQFPSLDSLKAQLVRDVTAAQTRFSGASLNQKRGLY